MAIKIRVDKDSYNTFPMHPNKIFVDWKEDGCEWDCGWISMEELEELQQRREDELAYDD